jgi:uncharacterized circularly permuted ATP-grasp superfamily protein
MSKKTDHFSEMSCDGGVRPPYASYQSWFDEQDVERLSKKAQEAEAFFRRTGITFNVYGQADAEERLIPFDLVPRICPEASSSVSGQSTRFCTISTIVRKSCAPAWFRWI